MNKAEKKELAWEITLILLALYFSMLENFIPKPFPWLKFGLSNIASIIAVQKFGMKMGLRVTFYRIMIYGVVFASLFTPGFIISFCAGIVSTLATGSLIYLKKFSITAVSAVSGMVHNMIQLIVVYFLLFRNIDIFERGILIFTGSFLLMGAVAGIITGALAVKMFKKSISN
jgi:heptaprenyl diphosphate synthase